jgi:hypothetical protein
LLLVAIAAFITRKGGWSPHLKFWAASLVILTAPYYLSYFISTGELWTLERISYGWVFLAIGAAAVCIQPGFRPLFVGLAVGSAVTLIVQLTYGGDRPSLEFNPIPYAEVAAGFFCLLCVGVVHCKHRWQVIGAVLGLAGWAAVVIVTETRGAMLAMLPGLGFLIIHGARRYGRRASILALLVFCFGALGIEMLSGKQVSQRFQLVGAEWQSYQEYPERASSLAIRLELYRAAVLIARQYPFGLGEERARAKVLEWIDEGEVQPYVRPSMEVAHFHSDWFQQLVVAGWIGVLFLLLFFSMLLGYFYRYREQLPAQMGMVFVASFIVSGFTDVPLYNRLTLFTLFLIVTFCFVGLKGQAREASR